MVRTMSSGSPARGSDRNRCACRTRDARRGGRAPRLRRRALRLAARLRREFGDGVNRDAELGGDVLVRPVASDAVEDQALTLGQGVSATGRRTPV